MFVKQWHNVMNEDAKRSIPSPEDCDSYNSPYFSN